MSLIPAVTDPNRAKELERMKHDPHSFGADLPKAAPNPQQEKQATLHIPKKKEK